MKDRFTELWDETVPTGGPCPQPEPDAVLRRVNAALDAIPRERRSYMKHKVRMAAVAAAAVLALTGTAVAAGIHSDLLANFFKGDTTPGQNYLDDTVRTVSDGHYTFTVEGAAADENTIYMTVEVAAKDEETKAFLFSDGFWGMDTFSVRVIETAGDPDETDQGDSSSTQMTLGSVQIVVGTESDPDDPDHPDRPEKPDLEAADEPERITTVSYHELESTSENSRRFALSVGANAPVALLGVRCGYMEEDLGIELPVQPAPSVTVEINASGTGVCDYETLTPGTLTIDRVRLTPFTCTVDMTDVPVSLGDKTDPNFAFRMADGTIRTQNQMMNHSRSGATTGRLEERDGVSYGTRRAQYQFREVQDLNDIVSVIAFDVEYPLDGGKPVPLAHDPSLDPFTLPLMEPLAEHSGSSLSVQALTEGLGGVYEWNAVEKEAVCTCRGVTIRLHPGEDTAEVNGETVTLHTAPAIVDGVLLADSQVFDDAWGIYSFVLRTESEDGKELIWHDWYIIP